jgi:hypothetical protein
MTKFWALILSSRPHIYALGKHENVEEAEGFAESFCNRMNANNEEMLVELKKKNPEAELSYTWELAWIMDESDLRCMIGEVHRPIVVLREKEVTAVESPKKHGGEPETLEEL